MKNQYQSNYIEGGITRTGREVVVTDDGASYAYPMADTDTLYDVRHSFLAAYDFGDAASCTVQVHEYRDGVCVDSLEPITHCKGDEIPAPFLGAR